MGGHGPTSSSPAVLLFIYFLLQGQRRVERKEGREGEGWQQGHERAARYDWAAADCEDGNHFKPYFYSVLFSPASSSTPLLRSLARYWRGVVVGGQGKGGEILSLPFSESPVTSSGCYRKLKQQRGGGRRKRHQREREREAIHLLLFGSDRLC